jgi:hypothetical protein
MTIDLFEAKNLDQVALNIVTVKRETGHGFDKQAAPDTPTALSGKVLLFVAIIVIILIQWFRFEL